MTPRELAEEAVQEWANARLCVPLHECIERAITKALAALGVEATKEQERLRKENVVLRGLVQCNPQWKCTYGYMKDGRPLEGIGECPLGFPGCSCSDDLLCAYCEPPTDALGTPTATAVQSHQHNEHCAVPCEIVPSSLSVEVREKQEEIDRLRNLSPTNSNDRSDRQQ